MQSTNPEEKRKSEISQTYLRLPQSHKALHTVYICRNDLLCCIVDGKAVLLRFVELVMSVSQGLRVTTGMSVIKTKSAFRFTGHRARDSKAWSASTSLSSAIVASKINNSMQPPGVR